MKTFKRSVFFFIFLLICISQNSILKAITIQDIEAKKYELDELKKKDYYTQKQELELSKSKKNLEDEISSNIKNIELLKQKISAKKDLDDYLDDSININYNEVKDIEKDISINSQKIIKIKEKIIKKQNDISITNKLLLNKREQLKKIFKYLQKSNKLQTFITYFNDSNSINGFIQKFKSISQISKKQKIIINDYIKNKKNLSKQKNKLNKLNKSFTIVSNRLLNYKQIVTDRLQNFNYQFDKNRNEISNLEFSKKENQNEFDNKIQNKYDINNNINSLSKERQYFLKKIELTKNDIMVYSEDLNKQKHLEAEKRAKEQERILREKNLKLEQEKIANKKKLEKAKIQEAVKIKKEQQKIIESNKKKKLEQEKIQKAEKIKKEQQKIIESNKKKKLEQEKIQKAEKIKKEQQKIIESNKKKVKKNKQIIKENKNKIILNKKKISSMNYKALPNLSINKSISPILRTTQRTNSKWFFPKTCHNITESYGEYHPELYGTYDNGYHHAIDYACGYGTSIYSPTTGKISQIKYNKWGYGTHIVFTTNYKGHKMKLIIAHLSSVNVYVGKIVRAGDIIGMEGSTGNSTGSHTHFELWQDGYRINPEYLWGK